MLRPRDCFSGCVYARARPPVCRTSHGRWLRHTCAPGLRGQWRAAQTCGTSRSGHAATRALPHRQDLAHAPTAPAAVRAVRWQHRRADAVARPWPRAWVGRLRTSWVGVCALVLLRPADCGASTLGAARRCSKEYLRPAGCGASALGAARRCSSEYLRPAGCGASALGAARRCSQGLPSEWFGRTIIHSDHRFSYEDAQEVLENVDGDVLNPNPPTNEVLEKYQFPLHTLNHLAKILKKERFRNGAINFETNEVKFKLDETGKPLGVVLKVRKDAHKLIEEFMLLANKKVAEFVFKLKHGTNSESNTMVYRVHEPPNPEKMQNFAAFAARFGYSIKTDSDKTLSNSMNKMMAEVEGTPVQNVLEQLAVRTMSKARYTTEPLGHFGLAFEHYSHFTSPIRRYPDMMAHRLLQHYLTLSPKKKDTISQDDFEKKSKHSSDREKLAAEAERASIKYKQVEFMSLQERRTIYTGVVTGVTDFGIFVEITSTSCEGMVRLADLKDDFYEWDRANYRVVGKRTGRLINFGDTVKVSVKGTDLERRSMDLELISLGDKMMVSNNTANKRDKKDSRRNKAKNSSSRKNTSKGKPRKK